MPVKQRRAATLAEDLDMLLDEVCAKWQYRNEPTGAELIAKKSPVTALDFTGAVLLADGFKPDSEPNLVRQVKRKFIQRYGLEVSPETYEGQPYHLSSSAAAVPSVTLLFTALPPALGIAKLKGQQSHNVVKYLEQVSHGLNPL